MRFGILSAFLLGVSAAWGGIEGGAQTVSCPQTPEEWAQRRDGMIVRLLTPDYSFTNSEAGQIENRLASCKMSSKDLSTASTPAEKCLQATSDLVHEFSRPLAKDAEHKYTAIPSYLQDAKLVDLLNHQQIAEAEKYLKKVVAKKPGVPELVFDIFRGTVATPGASAGQDRFVVKLTEPDGTMKWINFAVTGPDEKGTASNISVVSHTTSGFSYFQDWDRSLQGQSLSVKALRSQKDCQSCHIQGYNAFPVSHLEKGMTALDYPGRLSNFEKLAPENKGQFRPMGDDGKPLDLKKFGPSMGSGPDLESRRTDQFIDSCFQDIKNSTNAEDRKYQAELTELMKNSSAYDQRKKAVKNNMTCGSCHNGHDMGTLPFPTGLGTGLGRDGLTGARFHLDRIYDGSMPADDYDHEALLPADRRVLASCLFKEQYGFPPDQAEKPSLAQIKSGRFYQFLAGVDCKTGLPVNPSSLVFGGGSSRPPASTPAAPASSGQGSH